MEFSMNVFKNKKRYDSQKTIKSVKNVTGIKRVWRPLAEELPAIWT